MAEEKIDDNKAFIDIVKKEFPNIDDAGLKAILSNISIEGGGKREVAYPLAGKNGLFTLAPKGWEKMKYKKGPKKGKLIYPGGYLHNVPTARAYMIKNGYATGTLEKKKGKFGQQIVRGTYKPGKNADAYKKLTNSQKLGVMYNGDKDKPAGGFGPLQLTLGKAAGGQKREDAVRAQYKKSGHKGDFNSYMEKINNDKSFGLEQTLQYYKTNDPGNWNAKSLNKNTSKGLGSVINPKRSVDDTLIKRFTDGDTLATDSITKYNKVKKQEVIKDAAPKLQTDIMGEIVDELTGKTPTKGPTGIISKEKFEEEKSKENDIEKISVSGGQDVDGIKRLPVELVATDEYPFVPKKANERLSKKILGKDVFVSKEDEDDKTTTETTTETSTDTETPFMLPSVKQALENSKDPEYIKELEKQGYTSQQYLENPEQTLNEISKKLDLESDLGEVPAPPIFSMGAENKDKKEVEIKTPTEDINEVEEDDKDDFPGGADYVAPQSSTATVDNTVEEKPEEISILEETQKPDPNDYESSQDYMRARMDYFKFLKQKEENTEVESIDEEVDNTDDQTSTNIVSANQLTEQNQGLFTETDTDDKDEREDYVEVDKIPSVGPKKIVKGSNSIFNTNKIALPLDFGNETNAIETENKNENSFMFSNSALPAGFNESINDSPSLQNNVDPTIAERSNILAVQKDANTNETIPELTTEDIDAIMNEKPKEEKYDPNNPPLETIDLSDDFYSEAILDEKGEKTGEYTEGTSPGEIYASKKAFVESRIKSGNTDGEFFRRSQDYVRKMDQFYNEITTMKRTDNTIDNSLIRGAWSLTQDLPGAEKLDFDKFEAQMKQEILNIIHQDPNGKDVVEKVLQGDMPSFERAGWNKNDLVMYAKSRVLEKQQRIIDKQLDEYKKQENAFIIDKEAFEVKKDDFQYEQGGINSDIKDLKDNYGEYFYDARLGREVYYPATLRKQMSEGDLQKLEFINQRIVQSDKDFASLSETSASLSSRQKSLIQQADELQEVQSTLWRALALDPELALDAQNAFKRSNSNKSFDQWYNDDFAGTFLGGAADIAGTYYQEIYRYTALTKFFSNGYALGATLVGLGLAGAADSIKQSATGENNAYRYTYTEKYLDFFTNLAGTNIVPTNNIDKLFNTKGVKPSGNFFKDLTNPDAYNWSPYTMGKEVASLFGYTRVLAMNTITRKGLSMTGGAQQMGKRMAQKRTLFNKGMNKIGLGNIGDDIILSLHKNWKPSKKFIQNVRMLEVNQKMLVLDNIADGRANGLDGHEAVLYGNLTALATGLSQTIMPDVAFFKTIAGKNLLGDLMKGLKKAMPSIGTAGFAAGIRNQITKKAIVEFATNFAKEHGEEQLDVAMNDIVKSQMIANYSPEITNAQAQGQILIGTSLLTGTLGIKKARSTVLEAQAHVNNEIFKHGSNTLELSQLRQKELKKKIKYYGTLSINRPQNGKHRAKLSVFTEELKKEKQAYNNVYSTLQAYNATNEFATVEMIDNLVKKSKLESKLSKLKKKDKTVNGDRINSLTEEIKALNLKIEQSTPDSWKKKLYENSIKRGKALLSKMDINIRVMEAETQEEYDGYVSAAKAEVAAYNKENKGKKNKKGKKKQKKDKSYDGNGMIVYNDYTGEHVIIINKKSAFDPSQDNYGVGVHEIFHAVFRNTIKKKGGAQKVKALSFLLRQELLKNPRKYGFIMGANYVTSKFAEYEKQVNSMEWDEMFTTLSEGLAQGDIRLENNFLTKLHDIVRRGLRTAGINADFFPGQNPAKAMLNFIRDYNDELLSGDRENFSEGMQKIIRNGLNIKIDKEFIEKAEAEENKKIEEGKINMKWDKSFSALSTRSTRNKKDIYTRNEVLSDIKLKDSTKKIVEENDRIRKELLESRVTLEDGTFEYDEDLRNDLVLNNMALVTALSDFAAKNPKIMGLEKSKRVGFEGFQSGFSKELINLSRTYDPALVPFGAYLNMLLPLRYGDALKGEQKGAIEGSVSIDNEAVAEIPNNEDDFTPDDFDAADRFVAPKKNVAREVSKKIDPEFEQNINTLISEGLKELKEFRELSGKMELSQKDNDRIEKLKTKLQEKRMLDIDFDTMEISNIEGISFPLISKMSGVDVDKLDPRSKSFLANLRKDETKRGGNEVRSAQQFIVKVGPSLILSAIFNEGHTAAFKSTNMPGVLLKFGYNKGSKRIKNNYPQYKKPNLSEKDFAEYLGIFRVAGKYEFRVDRNTSARILAVLSLMDRTVTNQQLRKNLEATGDLDVRLKNALEDGLSSHAESIFYIKNPNLQEAIDLKMPALGFKIQEIDKNWSKTKMRNYVRSVFTEDGTLTKEQANTFIDQMFNESGVIMQYIYREEILTSQGVKNIESFENFAKKFLGKGNIHEGLIEYFGLKLNDASGKATNKAPSVSDLFDKDSVDRARINVGDFIENGIIEKWRKGKMSVEEVLDMIYMYEQENATAYKIDDGSFVYEPGTNIKIDKEASGKTKRQQFFAANKEEGGAKLDFRLWVWNFIGEDFKAEMTDSQKAAFTSSVGIRNDDNYSSMGLMPKDGKDVAGRMIRTIKSNKGEKIKKNSSTWDQDDFSKEAELAQRLTIEKILFFTDLLSKDQLSEQDFVLQMVSLNSNPTTSLRRGAEVIGIMDGIIDSDGNFLLGDLSNDNIRFEHSKPAVYLLMSLIRIATDKKSSIKAKKAAMDNEYVDYKVSIINKDADDTLDNAGYKFLMYDGYTPGNPDGWAARMFNDYNLGFDFVKPIRLIKDVVEGNLDGKVYGETHGVASELLPKSKGEIDQDIKINELTRSANSITHDRKPVGMSAFDFDETVGISDNFVIATKDGETKRIASDEWPMVGDQLVKEGWKMDFSDFNKVTNGKPGPLMQKMKNQIKKFGPKNVFILTARAPESQAAIHAYLKSEGISIPIKNITGLGNSTGEAKALWMLNKFAEGYNDMYFVDDALPNVEAVKNVLEQLDIKSKVQQAIVSKSVNYDKDFNDILEQSSGIDSSKRFSDAKARRRGEGRGKFNIFIPPGAEDFLGLIYQFLAKGKIGEKQFEFFKKALIDPLNKAYRDLNNAKQAIANDFNALKKKMPDVQKMLFKSIGDTDYTYNDAIRVYLWNKAGFEIPGISKADVKNLVNLVEGDKRLKAFAELLSVLSRQKDGYVPPTVMWLSEDIRADLKNATDKIGRKQYFAEFLENMKIIFSPQNMNKIEAIYGRAFREALEDMLYRIENGTNRSFGNNKLVNDFMNWINGSIGTTMFFNARSAVLQTLSMVNFINFDDNNILAAAKAFANQKQFWADFSMIFNSDMLKQRRSGLNIDVNASELTDYLQSRGSGSNKYKAAVNYLLTKGFLPTQIADSFAIAMGGASFYRNRYNKYIESGMSIAEAKEKAFNDFQAIAEETQQSSRPDMVSQQQASVLGRIILAFQNTPMQYARLMKKAMLDLVNGRGDAKTNISRIIYYGAIQNIIFYTLQTALFAMLLGDDDDEEVFDKKKERVLNGSIDSILRGMGVQGAIVSTLKNMVRAFYKEQNKSYNNDESAVIMEMVNLSPPLGIKLRKIRDAERTLRWNKDLIEQTPFYSLKNPAWEAGFSFTQALTNIPLARLHQKTVNISDAFSQDMEGWQRIALMMGWSKWNLGVEDKKSKSKSKKNSRRSKMKVSG